MDGKLLKGILKKHLAWLKNEPDGEKANLRSANLSGANLSGADLRSANLYGADLSGANLDQTYWNIMTAFYQLQCPECGSYTAFKKAGGLIVELLIPSDAKRSSATSRKCRASKAIVVSITKPDGTAVDVDCVTSDWDHSFLYKIGETVEVNDFNENRWVECSTGIHHYITREEAVKHT